MLIAFWVQHASRKLVHLSDLVNLSDEDGGSGHSRNRPV